MISVAMASYNGEKYIRTQIQSVLDNLGREDEIVISDDGSDDQTIEIIQSFQDDRIHLLHGPKEGVNKNFEHALKHCQGDYIFLCDQDDLWYPNKVSKMMKIFKSQDFVLIEHDAKVIDSNGNIMFPSFFQHRKVRKGIIKNFLRNTYHGCLIAFSSELKSEIFPIPKNGCLHDQWIGLIAEMNGRTCFYNKVLMEYKRHGDNVSSFKHLPFVIQIKNRMILGVNLLFYMIRKNKKRWTR